MVHFAVDTPRPSQTQNPDGLGERSRQRGFGEDLARFLPCWNVCRNNRSGLMTARRRRR